MKIGKNGDFSYIEFVASEGQKCRFEFDPQGVFSAICHSSSSHPVEMYEDVIGDIVLNPHDVVTCCEHITPSYSGLVAKIGPAEYCCPICRGLGAKVCVYTFDVWNSILPNLVVEPE